jgi:hypothetical protein
MKKIMIVALFASVSAFASEITLSPGSSATIAAGEVSTVTCMGTADLAPRCTFKKTSNGLYDVYIGTELASTVSHTTYAVNEIKNYKLAGICR